MGTLADDTRWMDGTAQAALVANGEVTPPSGQPAINVPLYWNDDGLPIGVQLVAAYGREDVLLRVAGQLEFAHPWAQRTP